MFCPSSQDGSGGSGRTACEKYGTPMKRRLCDNSMQQAGGHTRVCVLQAADAMGLVRHQALQSRQQLAKVSVLASAFLLSVVLGNVALRYIPVSFSQVGRALCLTLPLCSITACMLAGEEDRLWPGGSNQAKQELSLQG